MNGLRAALGELAGLFVEAGTDAVCILALVVLTVIAIHLNGGAGIGFGLAGLLAVLLIVSVLRAGRSAR